MEELRKFVSLLCTQLLFDGHPMTSQMLTFTGVSLTSQYCLISQVSIHPGLLNKSNDATNKQKKACNRNGSYRRNVLNIDNICIPSMGWVFLLSIFPYFPYVFNLNW